MAEAGRKVLLVEDEALVAMLVEEALLEAGFQVIGHASSVREAMALLARERPDAVVLDLNLAGETALPVADALVASGIPYVIATGYGANGLPPAHRHAPVLTKPYDPAMLASELGRLCRAAA